MFNTIISFTLLLRLRYVMLWLAARFVVYKEHMSAASSMNSFSKNQSEARRRRCEGRHEYVVVPIVTVSTFAG